MENFTVKLVSFLFYCILLGYISKSFFQMKEETSAFEESQSDNLEYPSFTICESGNFGNRSFQSFDEIEKSTNEFKTFIKVEITVHKSFDAK